MLIALELAGFKSFADKTRFEFPDGITVIVGPNGSGKSNVVDAIKWVLGAQSAKALRGKDMIDVIFKGSSADGRKPCNSAEATLVFDNAQRQLAFDADEVQVTRRVYRSGEGEFQINGQACRLKDIRNLFRGTGVGVDAYSLIEQGKVDRMLQASPKDRRVIFEEAAGISRFNAKKIEANRRLDRVEQNLTRLKDIVDEVHTRLNRLKSQASKAQRYREMSSRLRELRSLLGWSEYSRLTEKADQIETVLERLDADQDVKATELQEAQQAAHEAEMSLHKVAEECQVVEARLQENLQLIAVCQNQQQALRARVLDSEEEALRQAARLASLRLRADSLQQEVGQIQRQVAVAQTNFDQAKQTANTASEHAHSLKQELAERSSRYDELRTQHVQLLRQASAEDSKVAALNNQLAEVLATSREIEQQAAQNESSEHTAREQLLQATVLLEQSRDRSQQSQAKLKARQAADDRIRRKLSKAQQRTALIQGQLSGAAERLRILQQLEQHLDGVDSGARYVIDLAKNSDEPTFDTIQGLVAELLNVDVKLAKLIDTALGHTANVLVLEDGRLLNMIRSGKLEIPGRLSMMRLDRVPARRFGEKIQLEGVQGVIGRADRLVRCKNKYLPLIRYLLGTTWLVDSLDVALELGHFRGAGLRFVTSAGELIESDGLLTMGATQSASGLVARRSEIQDSKSEIAKLETQRQHVESEITTYLQHLEELQPELAALQTQCQELSDDLALRESGVHEAQLRLESIEAEAGSLATALANQWTKREEVEPQIHTIDKRLQSLQANIRDIETELAEHESAIRSKDEVLNAAAKQETAAQVELARSEQKLEAAKSSLAQCTRGQSERQRAVQDAENELHRLRMKRSDSELEILRFTSELAEAYIRSEAEEAHLDALAVTARQLRAKRSSTAKHLDTARRALEKISQQRETSKLELERFRESRRTLVQRYTEDYEIDFEELTSATLVTSSEELSRMDAEASQLRQDISSVGEINMAALAELDELQERYDFLNGQYEDLVAAKESLQRIIQKINHDSRRMFTETLEVIRQNFQKLYRKSFGGGHADIVLEDGEDVLECGIDIIATPPGKTALSNSLLSGGEKALTAVALLLAIFQYRPSPFCVLDEVDAPFDEANIGRFVNVLNEFLDWTKFIIVTHSKKTMTASTTLYGVTMQESGVSKQVAVRFEDVNDKGEIIDPDKRRVA